MSKRCLHVGSSFIKSFWYNSCKNSTWFYPERFARINTRN